MLVVHCLSDVIGIFVGDPTSVNGVHEDVMVFELLGRGPCDHVEGSFGHIGLRMKLLFALAVEDTFHWGDIDHPRRCWTNHLRFQLADEVERNDRVDDLSCVAIHQGDVFYLLAPRICGPFVEGLAELIKRSEVNFLRFCHLAWKYTWKRQQRIIFDDSQSIWLNFIGKLQAQLLIFELLGVKLLRTDQGLSSIVDQYIKFLHILLDIVDKRCHLSLW